MNSTEGAALREDIFDDRCKVGKLLAASYDASLKRNGTRQVEGVGQQGSSVKLDKGFVPTHAGAFASRQDEGGGVGCGDGCHAAIIHVAAEG